MTVHLEKTCSAQRPFELPRLFDSTLPGTCESEWRKLLETTTEWCPPRKPLLVVSPHPDDEVLAAGGLIRIHALAGNKVSIVSVTNGEAAYRDWPGLSEVRRRELGEALTVLAGAKVESVHLDIPDGQVATHRSALRTALDAFTTTRPVLVAPYEFDGHPDHDATGAVCKEFARGHELTLLRYPIWTWHHRQPGGLVDMRWGRFHLDEPTRLVKLKAIACFASQLRPLGREPIVARHVLPYFERPFEAFFL